MPCDYKKYPANWHTEIRPSILDRAKDCCEVCKIKNKSIVIRGIYNNKEVYQRLGENYLGEVEPLQKNKIIKIVLTIAHLDNDVKNNDYSNLKAMCQLHHLRHDVEQHKRNSRQTINNKKLLQELF